MIAKLNRMTKKELIELSMDLMKIAADNRDKAENATLLAREWQRMYFEKEWSNELDLAVFH